jgi:prefoldin subunit 5
MLMRSRTGRTVMAIVLCACVATVTSSSTALAQVRGNSGLPAGSGNPMADLQGQLTVLQQQTAALQTQISSLSALGQDVSTLKAQMKSLMALQDQVNALMAQATKQGDALATVSKDVSALKDQMATLAVMQGQLAALTSQLTKLSNLQSQVSTLTSQVEALSSQSASEPFTGLAVYDAKDQKLGDVVGVQDNIAWVGLTIGEQAVVLQVFPQQLVGGSLYFDQTNCTGNAYINTFMLREKGANVFSLAAVSDPGGVIYAADPAASPFTPIKGLPSLRDSAGFCLNILSKPTVVSAKPIFTLDTIFQRPFHVR